MTQSGGNFLDDLLLGVKNVQDDGVTMPEEPTINFVGAVLVDDPVNRRTNVNISANPHAVSGTGFWHSTSGTLDAAASLVNLSTDTTGILPLTDLAQSAAHTNDLMTWTGTQWAPLSTISAPVVMAGEVTGTTAASVVSGGFTTASLKWAAGVTAASIGTNNATGTLALLAGSAATTATVSTTGFTLENNLQIFAKTSLAVPRNLIYISSGDFCILGDFLVPNSVILRGGTGSGGLGGLIFEVGPTDHLDFYDSGNVQRLRLDTTSNTTPLLQAATTVTSFTLGTNKSAATTVLQADAATTIQTLASTGTELANLSTPAAGTGPRIFGSSGRMGHVGAGGHITLLPGA